MRAFFRRHIPVIVTAAALTTVFQLGQPVAAAVAEAINSDKVDGKHAVGAGATLTQRAGKLVAADANGRLPNNIIATAPNAAKLGGVGALGWLRDLADSVDGDNILDGSLTGNDLADGSVQSQDLAADANWPDVFGVVKFDASLHPHAVQRGLVAENVHRAPAEVGGGNAPGTYCITDLPITPVSVSATPTLAYSQPVVAYAEVGPFGECAAVEGTQITVITYSIQTDQRNDGSFNLQVWGNPAF